MPDCRWRCLGGKTIFGHGLKTLFIPRHSFLKTDSINPGALTIKVVGAIKTDALAAHQHDQLEKSIQVYNPGLLTCVVIKQQTHQADRKPGVWAGEYIVLVNEVLDQLLFGQVFKRFGGYVLDSSVQHSLNPF